MTIQPAVFSLFYWHPFLFPPSPLPRPVKIPGGRLGGTSFIPERPAACFLPGHRPDHAGKTASGMRIFPGYGSEGFPRLAGKSPESHATTDEIPPQADIPAPVLVKPCQENTTGWKNGKPIPSREPPYRSWCSCRTTLQTKIRFPCYSAFPGQTRPRKSWRGKHHRIWTSLPYSSRATTPWLSIMSGRDGRPLWWTMPERVKKETRNTPQAVLHTIMKTWPASCWKWTGAGWATPPTRTNVFWIG